jgi:hypothetical protein
MHREEREFLSWCVILQVILVVETAVLILMALALHRAYAECKAVLNSRARMLPEHLPAHLLALISDNASYTAKQWT